MVVSPPELKPQCRSTLLEVVWLLAAKRFRNYHNLTARKQAEMKMSTWEASLIGTKLPSQSLAASARFWRSVQLMLARQITCKKANPPSRQWSQHQEVKNHQRWAYKLNLELQTTTVISKLYCSSTSTIPLKQLFRRAQSKYFRQLWNTLSIIQLWCNSRRNNKN